MRKLSLLTVVLLIFFAGCKKSKTNQAPLRESNVSKIVEVSNDKQLIEKLLRNLYEWKETKSKLNDFEPLEISDSESYLGLDLSKNKQRIEELKSSNLFSEKFIENYENIVASIDLSLKAKSFEWTKGELPPFGLDAEIWCNCQDSPDRYWQNLTVKNLKIVNNVASFSWSFENHPDYNIKAIKENNAWKILFLEGIDEKTFLNID